MCVMDIKYVICTYVSIDVSMYVCRLYVGCMCLMSVCWYIWIIWIYRIFMLPRELSSVCRVEPPRLRHIRGRSTRVTRGKDIQILSTAPHMDIWSQARTFESSKS